MHNNSPLVSLYDINLQHFTRNCDNSVELQKRIYCKQLKATFRITLLDVLFYTYTSKFDLNL